MTEQLTMGEERRDSGIALVLSHKEDYAERFHKMAVSLLTIYGKFTSDDVIDRIGMPSGHRNAIGGAIRRTASLEKLKIAGYQKSTRPDRHAGLQAIWTRNV